MKKTGIFVALVLCFLMQGCFSSGPEDAVRKRFELRMQGNPDALDYEYVSNREEAKKRVEKEGFNYRPFGKNGVVNNVEVTRTEVVREIGENTRFVLMEAEVRGNDVQTIYYTVVYPVVKHDGEWLVDFTAL